MSKRKAIISVICILLAFLAFGYVGIRGLSIGVYDVKPFSQSIQQGLDLKGGISAVYVADSTDVADFDNKMSGTLGVLRNRLDAKGYTEATINRQGSDHIRIEIPDVENPDDVLKIIGQPAKLEFIDPDGNVIITGEDVSYAKAAYLSGKGNEPVVSFELTSDGASAFADATARLAPNKEELKIVLDGETISHPKVNTAITGGSGYIEGIGSIDEARSLALLIESGALPLVIHQTEVRTISATLGVDALQGSILAGLIGIAILFLYMLIFYRVPGLVADIALSLYLLIVLYILAIASSIQLTLPGIAGIILGIGMAVDANVVIFERIKEELRSGKTLRTATEAGFKKAFVAIFDANITTIIAALVLMYFGTGSIKGFAITLTISVVVSMFSAVVVTKFLLRAAIAMGITDPKWFGVRLDKVKEAKVLPLTKSFKYAVIFSAVILLAGGIALGTHGMNLGIDFSGGTILTINMNEPADAQTVEGIMKQYYQNNDIRVAISDNNQVVARIQDKAADGDQQIAVREAMMAGLNEQYPNASIDTIERVGATAGAELVRNAIVSVLIACVLILGYIWIRFELVSGISAVLALVHDVLIMVAISALIRLQINSSFIAAILTIVGYSINNTIIIFDRIRDNRKRLGKTLDRAELVNRSVSQTLLRSINTSMTTLIMITVLYFLGVTSIREFAFPIICGIIFGTYSSILLTGPLWNQFYVWHNKMRENNEVKNKQRRKTKKKA